MKLKAHLPNFITCLNLLSGCIALVFVFNGELIAASYLVFIAMLFDFADGLVARALNVTSPIGKELDSLADVISFGAVPGSIMYILMETALAESDTSVFNTGYLLFMRYFPFLIVVCAALRLARFNVDTRQHHSFIGLPTPSASLFVVSFPLMMQNDTFGITKYLMMPSVIIVLTALISFLMISNIPLFALKFQTFSWADNKIKFIFLVCAIGLFAAFLFSAIPLILLLYILLSLLENFVLKPKDR